jgi:hypothetical protein
VHIWRFWYKYRDDGNNSWTNGVIEVLAPTGIEAMDTLKDHFSAGCVISRYIQMADAPRVLW